MKRTRIAVPFCKSGLLRPYYFGRDVPFCAFEGLFIGINLHAFYGGN